VRAKEVLIIINLNDLDVAKSFYPDLKSSYLKLW